MSKNFGFDLIQDEILDRLAAEIAAKAAFYEQSQTFGDTPIERLLFGSMSLAMKYLDQEYFSQILVVNDQQAAAQLARTDSKVGEYGGHPTIFAQKQSNLVGWRADFIFSVYATWAREPNAGRQPGWARLIVECDGHDFHERTKEQATRDRERDRSAQMAGTEIFRFTGSELWRNPLGCAEQVIAWANKRV